MSTPAGRLKHARKLRGLNQIQLAEKAGVATGTIGNIESGKRGIKSSALVLAKALNVNPDWLATGEGEMELPLAERKMLPGSLAHLNTGPWPENPDPMSPEDERQLELQTLGKALKVLANRINEVEDASLRNAIGQRLMTLASAPDSKKAMDGVLELFDSPVTGYAEKVIEMKLTKESSDVFQQGTTQDAHSKL